MFMDSSIFAPLGFSQETTGRNLPQMLFSPEHSQDFDTYFPSHKELLSCQVKEVNNIINHLEQLKVLMTVFHSSNVIYQPSDLSQDFKKTDR